MKVEIDASEIDRQTSAVGVTVPFATALDQAFVDEESAPEGEQAAGAWVFVFFVEEFTDHGSYAAIDKAGAEAAYVYAFN